MNLWIYLTFVPLQWTHLTGFNHLIFRIIYYPINGYPDSKLSVLSIPTVEWTGYQRAQPNFARWLLSGDIGHKMCTARQQTTHHHVTAGCHCHQWLMMKRKQTGRGRNTPRLACRTVRQSTVKCIVLKIGQYLAAAYFLGHPVDVTWDC